MAHTNVVAERPVADVYMFIHKSAYCLTHSFFLSHPASSTPPLAHGLLY
jgi:hypothetical protein